MSEKKRLNEELSKIHKMMGIVENKITYDPSKIDEFVEEAKKDIEMGKNLISKFGSMLVNTPLIALYENLANAEAAQKKISESEKYLRSKFDKFYNIVEMYYSIDEDRPDNVDELDDLSNKIDDLSYRLADLEEGLEAFIDMIGRLSKYNEELFKTQNID